MQVLDVEGGRGAAPAPKKRPGQLQFVFVCLIIGAAVTLLVVMGFVPRYFAVQGGMLFRGSPCELVTNVFDFQRMRSVFGRGGQSLSHNYTDEMLFWMASMEPQRSNPELQFPRKVAFLFLVKGKIHFAPLWEKFFSGQEGLYSIYVHASPDYVPVHERSSVFYGRYIPSQPTAWGEITICDAERRLLANALLDFSNERFVLVSESCIPLFSFSIVYNYLTASKYSFTSVFDDPGPFGRGRYVDAMAPEVRSEQWRKGSQWFEMNRKHAVAVVSDTKYYAKFSAFCKPACYVDEHYIPTLLSIEYGGELANRSITFTDWSRSGWHPATFGENDITPKFLLDKQNIKGCTWNDLPDRVCFMFARKFAPSALERLETLLDLEST